MFSGSYHSDDVIFLLKKINISSTSIEEKEKMIFSKKSHYSEMITFEKEPTKEALTLFDENLKLNGFKFAQHIKILADKILDDYIDRKEIVIVSLARAGTPIGILLKKFLECMTDKKITHYSISIIRDFGLDLVALNNIVLLHKDKDICFIDGWTGKGVIGKELASSVDKFNKKNNKSINQNLYVVSDIAGSAYYSSTHEDYLIPNAILNSTISGLISRTILNKKYISQNDFHGCILFDYLKKFDKSNQFIEKIFSYYKDIKSIKKHSIEKSILKKISQDNINFFLDYYNFDDPNYIKPGVGEATRVLLRRKPEALWIKEKTHDVKHLIYYAQNLGIPIVINPNLAYKAVSIIKNSD